ncbi:PREDICTED: probable E3 ubiquitin-protein ligase RNF144A-B [Tarenaya hassleriana]|uniref:probable E3 ubiquitin-protein ligase RNF144A-B n=1 Tax=Tarenaya hassleriana TaxID=28532 RepID=UPI00053C0877|nr:PREDICTED: probable E3 ubiquitin-protein ligase RNF144A-B [Tarenaya hassleriana]
MAAQQSVHAEIIDLAGDNNDGDDADSADFLFSMTPLSVRGSTKRDAISVEHYADDRDLQLAILASLPKIKRSKPQRDLNFVIDLERDDIGSGYDDDDDLRVLYFTPTRKTLETGQSSRSPPQPQSQSQSLFVCDICVESRPGNESFRIKGCSHSYCDDCISKYVASKLQNNILTVSCPVSGCSGNLEPELCRRILPKEVFDRWGDALCEAVILGSKRFYCPYKDCSALLVVDNDNGVVRESECPHCNRLVCVACGVKWHSEITCEEFQELGEDEREREDVMLKKLAEKNKWKRCPKCKFYIEKSQGCLYMMCRCGLAFCYNCGSPSQDNSHYCHKCKH